MTQIMKMVGKNSKHRVHKYITSSNINDNAEKGQ